MELANVDDTGEGIVAGLYSLTESCPMKPRDKTQPWVNFAQTSLEILTVSRESRTNLPPLSIFLSGAQVYLLAISLGKLITPVFIQFSQTALKLPSERHQERLRVPRHDRTQDERFKQHLIPKGAPAMKLSFPR